MTYQLGRRPSPPDARDYRLSSFLPRSAPDPLDTALAAFLAKHYSAAAKTLATLLVQRVKAISPAPPTPPKPASTDVVWPDADGALDQGEFGTCVGNGWAQWGNTAPVDDHYDEPAARAIYFEATVIDGQPDNPDVPGGGQQGSTVRSGAKAMQARGRLKTYAFAKSIDEVRAWLDGHGPVVFGTEWDQPMFTPDSKGFVHPDGNSAGGHCYVCVGDLPSEGALLFENSWGTSWGLAGQFKMSYTDAASLLARQGEACAAAEL